jgi:hypothetical protein
MNELKEKEQIMRDYWLGALNLQQTEQFETDWFSNDDDAELLEIARAELIDDYLSKTLPETEYAQFENSFLLNNLEDVVMANSSLQISREEFVGLEKEIFFEGFFSRIRNFIRSPQIAIAVLLLACFGLWFKFYDNDSSQRIVRNAEPVGNLGSENKTNLDDPDANYNKKDALAAENEIKNTNIKTNEEIAKSQNPGVDQNSKIGKKQTTESSPTVPRQVVFLAVFRGSVKTVSLTNPKEIVTLKLMMPGLDKVYKNYVLKISDGGNNLVVKQDLGNKLTSKKSGEILMMPPLKGSLFKKNNIYKTYLVGIDENGNENELINYDSFKID